ncbi:MAG: KOW domain-containing protein [Roseburia sp.]|nr:KOW domain-containing protein [Roseburia sp.]
MEFAKSLSGHDRNQIYLVKEKDEKFVFLVNGTTKPLAAPKKKSLKHVQLIKNIPIEIEEILSGSFTDLEVKRAVKLYKSIIQ